MTTTPCVARARSVFVVHCRCDRCVARRYRVRKLVEHRLPTSRATLDEARAVLDMHIRHGYSATAIASIVGVPINTAKTWVRRRQAGHMPRLGPVTRDLIVATVNTPPTAGLVRAEVTRRKLWALAHQGWSPHYVARTYDMPVSSLYDITRQYAQEVRVAIEAGVAQAWRDLDGTVGPSGQAQAKARREKWPTAAAWDNINDLAEEPKGVPGLGRKRDRARPKTAVDPERVEAACHGEHVEDLTHTERCAIVARLVEAGLSYTQIIRRTGISQPGRYINHHEEKVPA